METSICHSAFGEIERVSKEVMVIDQAYLTQGLRSRTAPGHPNARCGLGGEGVVCNLGNFLLQCLMVHNLSDQIMRQP